MRIIAGNLGGRLFDSPGTSKTHPMSDKMRGALFGILGDISGLRILDAFAGSGALSFEAISRGARTALAIDSDKTAQKVIAKNIELLGLGQKVKLVKASAGAWASTNFDKQFDIVLCDPPYNKRQAELLKTLAGFVRPAGLLVLSWPAGQTPPEFENLKQVQAKTYGDAQLIFFRA